MRKVSLTRKTAETQIALTLNLDGTGLCDIDSSVSFFDHMLLLFAKHGRFDLMLKATGDGVDTHHVIEDIGILLGKAFSEALGDKAGINRYGFQLTPMDEVLARVCIDISGRPYLVWDVPFTREFIGEMETEMFEEFFIAFANNAKMTVHIATLYGRNNHHLAEGVFKCFGRTLRQCVAVEAGNTTVPSTKGMIE